MEIGQLSGDTKGICSEEDVIYLENVTREYGRRMMVGGCLIKAAHCEVDVLQTYM